MTGQAVGIDLGTTNSVVAVAQGGRPRVLPQADGNVLIPSVVAFEPDGRAIVGTPARARRAIDPVNTVSSVKRLLGRGFASEEVQASRGRFPFELRPGDDGGVLVHSRAGDLTLPEVSALVLREVRRVASAALGEEISRAVVTVPANFNELQRTATKLAGQIADLDVIRILNEPTAAALAYGYGRGASENIAVYDFGGGTFDVTLLALRKNVFEVLATAGDTFLGGDDVDALITQRLAEVFVNRHGFDPRKDPVAAEKFRAAAERAKIDLSSVENVTITIPELPVSTNGRTVEFSMRFNRAELERLVAPLLAKTIDVCQEAMRLAGLTPSAFESVILVGGSARIPAVRTDVLKFFGREPLATVPPEQVVALGSAIFAEVLAGGGARRRKSSATMQAALPPTRPGMDTAPLPASAQPDASGVPGTSTPAASPGPSRPGVRTFTGLSDEAAAVRAPEQIDPRGARGAFERDESTAVNTASDLNVPSQGGVVKSTIPVLGANAPPAEAQPAPAARPSSTLPRMEAPAAVSRVSQFPDEPTHVRLPQGIEEAARATSNESEPAIVLRKTAAPTLPRMEPPPAETIVDLPVAVSPGSPSVHPARSDLADDPSGILVLPTALPGFSSPPAAAPATRESAHPVSINPDSIVPLDAGDSVLPPAHVPPPPRAAFEPFSDVSGLSSLSAAVPLPVAPPVHPARSDAPSAPPPASAPAAAPAPAPSPARASQPGAPPPSSQTSPLEMSAGFFNLKPVGPSIPPRPSMPMLLEVTPLSLGLEMAGGLCECLIPRNASIPIEVTREFSTARDNQQLVRLRIAQGESRNFPENQFLGQLELTGLPRARRGDVTIAVTFGLDADGMLIVRAKEARTGLQTEAKITLAGLPDASAAERMAERQRRL